MIGALHAGIAGQSALDRPLSAEFVVVPSLDDAAIIERIGDLGKVAIGFQQATGSRAADRLDLPVLPARTPRQALNDFVRFDRRYRWEERDGVAVVRPTRAWTDRSDLLNRQVRGIAWHDIVALEALVRVADLAASAAVPGPQPRPSGFTRVFSVVVDRGTTLDVLNAIARAHGEVGWTATRRGNQLLFSLVNFAFRPGGEPKHLGIGLLLPAQP
jgi:hypothetical protein